MMKIYTKNGDFGETTLIGGTKVSKAEIKVDVYGSIDELNSHIGLIIALFNKQEKILTKIQEDLFKVGNVFATDWQRFDASDKVIKDVDIDILEKEIDRISKIIPNIQGFVLPGGNVISSHIHIARTIARRTERIAVAYSDQLKYFITMPEDFSNNMLQPQSSQNPKIKEKELACVVEALRYLNRLSDYLFVLAIEQTQ
ncbi:ATP--cob(I)alamin adenosyltransferase [Bacteroidia bacterium]|nr:ATP--cob(I)alamin adenosyltransferase [Bacteroidia bacterium]